MPQISKVERDHDIKQVSRLEDLKPATEKSVSRATPQIRGKPQINETQQNLQTSANAARRASIAAIRHKEDIPYAIVTNLSEEKLKAVLGNELKQYSPYVILSRAMYKAMRNSFLNDERERLRNIKYHDAFALDAAMCLVNELADPALICESLYTMDCILNRIRELPKKVGPRVYKRYVVGFTIKEIAEQENTNIWVILKSIERAMPDIHDIFVEMEVVA